MRAFELDDHQQRVIAMALQCTRERIGIELHNTSPRPNLICSQALQYTDREIDLVLALFAEPD